MSSSLRPVSITDDDGTLLRANHVVGVDESGNDASAGGVCVTVAVRTRRRNDPLLVRELIEHDLEPFRHKSSTLVRYGAVGEAERKDRVSSLVYSLRKTPITWSAIVCEGRFSHHERAAATSMAAKKAVTNAIEHAVFPDGNERAVLLHDGKIDHHGKYEKRLREQAMEDFGSSFRHGVCPTHLTFLQDADRTYPQANAADYLAGYLRSRLASGESLPTLDLDNVHKLDSSWLRDAKEPAPVYRLAELKPIRESDLRSRILSWLLGRGVPVDPTPTTRDPTRELVGEIPDATVREYLLSEL